MGPMSHFDPSDSDKHYWDEAQKWLEYRGFPDGRGGFRTCDLSRVKQVLPH
jgi:hypothetical protein